MMEMQGNATEIDAQPFAARCAALPRIWTLAAARDEIKGPIHRGEGTLRIPELICRRGGHGFPINFPHSRRA